MLVLILKTKILKRDTLRLKHVASGTPLQQQKTLGVQLVRRKRCNRRLHQRSMPLQALSAPVHEAGQIFVGCGGGDGRPLSSEST